MRVPRPPRPRRRTAVLGGAGLLAGVVAGWVAGLLRGPRPVAPADPGRRAPGEPRP